ncbi:S1 family peptidase, partial [Saccharibacillus qingshengii]|uniref:S1 family peptidase n=1 Tax=Saccharibacillus qingshengii TaxID=1763540 RepID=UPI001C12D921
LFYTNPAMSPFCIQFEVLHFILQSVGYKSIGYEHWSGYNNTSKLDMGLIRLTNPNQYITSRFYTDANGGGINGQLKQYLTVGEQGIKVGLVIKKSGNTTGITSSTVTKTGTWATYGDQVNGVSLLAIESELVSGTGKLIPRQFYITPYEAVAGSGDSGSTVYRASDNALIGVQSGIKGIGNEWEDKSYSKTMWSSPAWYANNLLGAIYQYTSTSDIPVSRMQGQ